MIHLADSSGQTEGFSQCVTHGSFPQWWHQAFYNFFTFSCLFIIPLLIMLICNAKIMFTLTRVLQQDPHSMYSSDLVLIAGRQCLTAIQQAFKQNGTYYQPKTILSRLHRLTYFNIHSHPIRGYFYYPQFTDAVI